MNNEEKHEQQQPFFSPLSDPFQYSLMRNNVSIFEKNNHGLMPYLARVNFLHKMHRILIQ